MSLHDYKMSREIAVEDYPFAAIIMAAMRQADSLNAEGLKRLFPSIWHEFQDRYSAPGGYLTDKERNEDLAQYEARPDDEEA